MLSEELWYVSIHCQYYCVIYTKIKLVTRILYIWQLYVSRVLYRLCNKGRQVAKSQTLPHLKQHAYSITKYAALVFGTKLHRRSIIKLSSFMNNAFLKVSVQKKTVRLIEVF